MEEQITLFGSPKAHKKHEPATTQHKAEDEKKTSSTAKMVILHVFVDGAARGNPGAAGAGVYITTHDRVPLIKKGYYLKHKTNNQAEYLALILACLHIQELVKREPNTRVVFHSDSQLLVRQIQGVYKVKNEILIGLHQAALKLLRPIFYTITHVAREANAHADKLANLGVDKRGKISQAFVSALEAHGVTID